MKFVADLHLHSKYSRAVSQSMVLSKMAEWARFKGSNVLATGDFTHPFWFEQLKNELEDAGNGLYKLKSIVHSSQFTEKSSEPLTVNQFTSCYHARFLQFTARAVKSEESITYFSSRQCLLLKNLIMSF